MGDSVAKLADILHRERDALRQGMLGELEGLAREKEVAIAGIGGLNDAAKLQPLRDLARRNAEMLEAARRGVAAARARVLQLTNATADLRTYTRAGQMTNLSGATRRIERKA
ncbi:hypothetical protein ACMU_02305 [Actibacterium mucosum KCTC 23349]|uniref:Flagellar biosynthesis protein FlgN n=1 Tax=Actibacterium mucosum KCTC 23349 TaxID=1454373 RepID=A0A037ZNW8_9RHOB|nr:hypothetical protein [Actibacterium mucosum]KAJ57355.1 hypothetical protein ACMU_02305 [Actibacterium mucosum KCTC 23349]